MVKLIQIILIKFIRSTEVNISGKKYLPKYIITGLAYCKGIYGGLSQCDFTHARLGKHLFSIIKEINPQNKKYNQTRLHYQLN